MRIAYCTNVRLPSERAHGHQIAQVCDALTRLGHAVTVFHPYRRNVVTKDFHSYYGVPKEIGVRELGTFDPINRLWLPGVTGLWTLNALLRREYRKALAAETFDVLYTRAPALLPALLKTGMPVILELHQLPRFGRKRFVRRASQCHLVACLTSAMRDTLIAWGVPKEKVIAEGDGVDLKRFAKVPMKETARASIGMRTNRLVVGYVGRLKTLGMEKGVKHLLEALKEVQSENLFMGLIVGGPADDADEYRRLAAELKLTDDDVRFTGEVPAALIPEMLSACDILAMPFPDLPHYRHHMSPLKMFEYMAASRPIVTSDLPTIRDVLSEDTAYFCEPGDVSSLVAALKTIAKNTTEAGQKARAARMLAEHHTWEERMKRVLDVFRKDTSKLSA